MPTENWVTSVDELAKIFHAALIALVPIVERAHIPWKEPDNYDDWDAIVETIYASIVSHPVAESSEWKMFGAIPPYDGRIDNYSGKSFLTTADKPGARAFICFETEVIPFDVCLFGNLDQSGAVVDFERRRTALVKFVLAGHSEGALTIVDSLRVPT
jgi:hypothetical protein